MPKKKYDLHSARGLRQWFADTEAKEAVKTMKQYFDDKIELEEFIDFDKNLVTDQEGLIAEILRVDSEKKTAEENQDTNETEAAEVVEETEEVLPEKELEPKQKKEKKAAPKKPPTKISSSLGEPKIVNTSDVKRNTNIRSDVSMAAEDGEKFDRLVASVGEYGILQPLLVTSDLVLIAGYRRFLAAETVGLEQVPVYIVDIDPTELDGVQLIENLIREDLSPVDFVRGVSKYEQKSKKKRVEIAASLGIHPQYLSSLCGVVEKIPAELLDHINENLLSSFSLGSLISVSGMAEESMREFILDITPGAKVTIKDIDEVKKGDEPEPEKEATESEPEDGGAASPVVSLDDVSEASMSVLIQQLYNKLEDVEKIEDPDILDSLNTLNSRIVEVIQNSI